MPTKAMLEEENAALRRHIVELERRLAGQPQWTSAAEQPPDEAKTKLEKLFDILPVGISVLDQEGRVVKQNPALGTILGLSAEGLTHGAYRQRQYIRPDGTSFPAEEFPSARVLRGEATVQDVEIGLIKEDGQKGWVQVSAAAVPFSDWKVVVVTRDVTDQMRAEEALRASEQRFSSIFNQGPIGMALSRLSDGQLVDVNPAITKLLGYSREEMLGHTSVELGIWGRVEDRPVLMKQIQDHKQVINFEIISRTKSGAELFGLLSAQIVEINQEEYFLGEIVDITERKRAEEALRESEQRFASIFKYSPIAVVISQLSDGEIVEANPAIQKLLGYSLAEMVGHTAAELGTWDDLQERQIFVKQLQAEKYVANFETTARMKSGTRVNVLISAQLVVFNQEELLLAEIVDITERKQSEEALRQAHDELETRVLQRTEELMQANIQLQAGQATLQGFYDSAPFMMGIAELEGGKTVAVSANRATADFFAVHPEDLPGQTGNELGNPEDFERLWVANYQRCQREAAPVQFEYEYPHVSEKRWLKANVSFIGIGATGNPQFSFVVEDITERKRAEEALRQWNETLEQRVNERTRELVESQQRFAMIFEYSPIPMGIMRLSDNCYVDANAAMFDLFGYSREELIGHTSHELGLWVDWQERQRFVEQLLADQHVFNIEALNRSKSGRLLNVLVSAQIIEIDREKYMVGQVIDITERKKAEQLLLEREHFITSVLNLTPANIYVYDMETQTNVFSMNGITRMLGYSMDEIRMMGSELFARLIHPDDLANVNKLQSQIMHMADDEILVSEQRARHHDGSWRYLRNFESPFLRNADGSLKQKIGVAIDVTEHKRAEAALRESEEKFVTVFKQGPVAMGIARLSDNRYVDVNEAMLTLIGCSREEVIGKTSQEIGIWLDPQERKNFFEQLLRGNRVDNLEILGRQRSGSIVNLLISAQIIEINEEKYMLGQIIDITARKNAEENLKQAHGELHALSRKMIELSEKERRAIGRELHDEIGQSLTGLRILLQMAQRPPVGKHQEKLEQAQQVAGELIDRVSAISLDLRPPMLDDMGLLPTLLWFVSRYMARTNIRVHLKHEGLAGQRFAAAIETAVYRLIQESLTNVARHAKVSEAEVRVVVENDAILLYIEDSGAGFDARAALEKYNAGGLSGMRERVWLLEGEMEINSAPRQGTRIMIHLPLIHGSEEKV